MDPFIRQFYFRLVQTQKSALFVICLLLFLNYSPDSYAIEWAGDIESGAVFSGYNDVRIPGDSGTLFSLTDDLDAERTFFYRVQVLATIKEKHTLRFLAAPLSVQSEGTIDEDIEFDGQTFRANEPLEATFRFDSYRITYRYHLLKNDTFLVSAGVTGKIRDAAITLKNNEQKAVNDNIGFVPLLHLYATWSFQNNWRFIFDADALAAPRGRAEDVFVGFAYTMNDRLILRSGYRILEGGADNDEVYTFSMFHYISLGLTVLW